MKRFIDWLLGRKPQLPDPFDDDVAVSFIDGPTAHNPKSGRKTGKVYPGNPLPPSRGPVPDEEEPYPSQHSEPEADKRGKPFSEWKEGEDYWQTAGYVTAHSSWKDPDPLAEHYNPAISKFRAAKTAEWRGMDENSWFNFSTPVDQPLGGHLQVIVDKSQKHTFHYCHKGHVHQFINDVPAKLTRYMNSKHFKSLAYETSNVDDLYYKPLSDTIKEVPECD